MCYLQGQYQDSLHDPVEWSYSSMSDTVLWLGGREGEREGGREGEEGERGRREERREERERRTRRERKRDQHTTQYSSSLLT